ncbi:MAG: hypothetical protein P8Y70_11185 [Candidatus Lokiarchaeota archaeon]
MINKTIYDLTKRKNSEIQLFIPNNYSNPISTYIDWNSAPDMKVDNMTLISKDSLGSHVHSIIDVYPASKNLQINQYKTPILMEVEKGNGNVILFAGWVEDKANLDFTLWPYFNYFLYTIAFETLGKPFQTYPNWDYSPVPHEFERLIILILIICLAILAVSLFVIVKRRSRSTIDQTTVEALYRNPSTTGRIFVYFLHWPVSRHSSIVSHEFHHASIYSTVSSSCWLVLLCL